MEQRILSLLAEKDYVPLSADNLQRHLRVTPDREPEFNRALRKLERDGKIACIKASRYVLTSDADLIPGRIRMNRAGKGFLTPDDSSLPEIAIAESATGTALHEDRVLVRRAARRKNFRDGDQDTGTVIRVLERTRSRIVGTLQQGRASLYVTPDDPRMPHDVLVPPARDVGRPARVGDKVVVELHEWEWRNSNPEGEIVEVLGAPDAEGVDMLSVLRQYDLPLHFPKGVLAEAHAIGSAVSEKDFAGRLDCRAHNVVTIDPDDAKDFDDAICLERVLPEQWRLWVHIADVSHYVKPGTELDAEARKRGNSTYLVDRVIPMLPEALSNELCSLKPNVDRLTKCVEFLVSNDGRVLSTKFHAAVIHSQRRFTYAQVLAILRREPANDVIEQMLHQAHQLAQKIRRHRFKNGSLDLDFPETKIRLDEQGKILRIEKNENDESHQLIEEYMLLANEAVATRLMSLQTPAIYRVHEEPDPRRLNDYRQEVLAHHVQCGNLAQASEVQKLLQKLGTLPIGAALKIGFLKSLKRACYSVEPLGHYGLAKRKYTHFTSPIRRYADLVVHRALFDKKPAPASALKEIADHISVTERNSADAERDSKDVKLFAFLKAQLASGDPVKYPALVTDVRNFGFFVDVTGLAMSGLVPLSTIEDDFYVFDEMRRNLVGRRTRRVIRLGDRLTVQVAKVDSVKKQVDFCLAVEKPRAGDQRPVAPRQFSQRPQQSPAKPQSPARPQQQSQRPQPHWKKSRPPESRAGRPQRDETRPAAAKPSATHFSTTQRPLIKSSGSNRFQKRRR
ncbi:MAG TPA: ribonuclease R [Verrucomicrobiae bacterium]|nr:ribonuclease R [Verrucomicrobiae bacterium]